VIFPETGTDTIQSFRIPASRSAFLLRPILLNQKQLTEVVEQFSDDGIEPASRRYPAAIFLVPLLAVLTLTLKPFAIAIPKRDSNHKRSMSRFVNNRNPRLTPNSTHIHHARPR
jgi:hypothetical protein